MLVRERTKELEASREQLRIQATHDGLTGMLNRVAILRALTAETDRALRENRTIIVALVDLDHFKRINDATDTWSAMRRCAGSPRRSEPPFAPMNMPAGTAARSLLT